VRKALHSFTKPWAPFIQGIVAREALPTWERMWDDFIQEEIRLASEASRQQHQIVSGDEELALWKKGKKKTGHGGRKGPKTRGQTQRSGGGAESSSGQGNGQGRYMSIVRCFACGEMGHYAG
jgi:hypothetical protein